MTYTKLPGVYFTESVTSETFYTQNNTPLFIIQTASPITSIDDKITEYTSFDAFTAIVEGKGLTNTVKYIGDILNEAGSSSFYIYSIKTDTASAFTDAVKNTSHLDDVKNVIYIEETKSGQANDIKSKITAIKNGLIDNANISAFREGYIIPYGTISDVVNNNSNDTTEVAILNAMLELTSGAGNGRISVILPDSLAGSTVGKCISVAYNEEAGYTPISYLDLTNIYSFNYAQMLSLMNNGIIFVKPEKVQGVTQYRINLGVTTSFKESAGDGLLISRTIADEMLRRINFDCQAFIKGRESESALAEIEAIIGAIIDEFAKNEDIDREGTQLTVTDAGNMTFNITGTIKPVRSLVAIEVSTVLV